MEKKSNKQILSEVMEERIKHWKERGTAFSYRLEEQTITLPFDMVTYQVAVKLTGQDSKNRPSTIILMKGHRHVDPLIEQLGKDKESCIESICGELLSKIGNVTISEEDFEPQNDSESKKLNE